MKLDSLSPIKGSISKRKRIGRGHRSGNKKRAWFEGGQMPLARRLPRRGFKNIFKEKFQVVNVGDLNSIDKNSTIDPVFLEKFGLIRSSLKPVKILGNGKVDNKFTISASAFSDKAKTKIEEAGGEVIVL